MKKWTIVLIVVASLWLGAAISPAALVSFTAGALFTAAVTDLERVLEFTRAHISQRLMPLGTVRRV